MATLLSGERAEKETNNHDVHISLVSRGKLLPAYSPQSLKCEQPKEPGQEPKVTEHLGWRLRDLLPFDNRAYADEGDQEQARLTGQANQVEKKRAVPHSWGLVLALASLLCVVVTMTLRWSRSRAPARLRWRDLYWPTPGVRPQVGPATVQDSRFLLAVLHIAMAIILLLLTIPYAPFEGICLPFSKGCSSRVFFPVVPLGLALVAMASSAWLCGLYLRRIGGVWGRYGYQLVEWYNQVRKRRRLEALRQREDLRSAGQLEEAMAGRQSERHAKAIEREDDERRELEQECEPSDPPKPERPARRPKLVHILPLLLWIASILLLTMMVSRREPAWLVERAYAFGHAMSPLLPALLLILCPLVWVASGLRRCPQLEWLRTEELDHLMAKDSEQDSLQALLIDLYEAFNPLARLDIRKGLAVFICVVAPCTYIYFYYPPSGWRLLRSLEPGRFDFAISVLFVAGLVIAVSSAVRLLLGACALTRILDVMRQWKIDWNVQDDMWTRIGERGRTTFRAQRQSRPTSNAAQGQGATDARSKAVREVHHANQTWFRQVMRFEQLQRKHKLRAALSSYARPEDGAPGMAGEAFFHDFVIYILTASGQLRSLLYLTVASFLLIFLSIATYPFQPQRLLLLYCGWLLTAASLIGTVVLTRVENDGLVRWAEGHAKKNLIFDPSFLQNVSASAVLPAISILATQFPALRSLLFDWVRPLLRMLG